MNPLRIRILTEIDRFGASTVTTAELGEAFNHARHWLNWSELWHLEASQALKPEITFRRKGRLPSDPRILP